MLIYSRGKKAGKAMPESGKAFEFATAARIVFGEGESGKAGHLAAELGKRALLVAGHHGESYRQLEGSLAEQGIEYAGFEVRGEPSTESVRAAAEQARQTQCDFVIGFGGGSAIDTAKAAAAMLTNPGEVLEYLEVIGQGRQLSQPSAPVLAIPTTAGTGSEVTRNAVIGSPERRVKVSLRSASMLPRIALVDPELTYSLPAEITFSSGLDALTQLIEPFVSRFANPLTDSLCREGIKRAGRALPALLQDLNHLKARRDMSIASLFGGLALANAKLGAVHGFAGTIGGMFPAPHGAVCARLLSPVMAANIQALEARGSSSDLRRYQEVAGILSGDPQAQPQDGIAWIQSLIARLPIPSLRDYGFTQADMAEVIEKSERSSSMRGNPIQLTRSEMGEILQAAY
jgi:alcohol dehydrogenase class IV